MFPDIEKIKGASRAIFNELDSSGVSVRHRALKEFEEKLDKKTRSRIMASVGQRNTGPELRLRQVLHRQGLRYRNLREESRGAVL